MKKSFYICPRAKACKMEAEPFMDGSVLGNNGLNYGGVDTEGTKDPDANGLNVWDDGGESDWPETHNNVFEE